MTWYNFKNIIIVFEHLYRRSKLMTFLCFLFDLFIIQIIG